MALHVKSHVGYGSLERTYRQRKGPDVAVAEMMAFSLLGNAEAYIQQSIAVVVAELRGRVQRDQSFKILARFCDMYTSGSGPETEG